MVVRKRDGSFEPVDLNKIIRAITRSTEGITGVDPGRVAVKTIGGLYNEASTRELDRLSIKTASTLIAEEPNYSKVAARMLAEFLRKEVVQQEIHSFSQAIAAGHAAGLIKDELAGFVKAHARKLNSAIDETNNERFEFFGLEAVTQNYLLRDPQSGRVIETPQYLFMRLATTAMMTVSGAIDYYRRLATSMFTAPTVEWENAGLKLPAGEQGQDEIPFRPLMAGMGQAVAERTILRRKPGGEWENWGDVANRVAYGNSRLASTMLHTSEDEYRLLRESIAQGITLMSGRHLQHGDADQVKRNMEVFTNCSTAAASFLLFYLLLNGSGVGRCYDDDMMLVDWDRAPNIRCVLDQSHPDFDWQVHESVRDAHHKYNGGKNVVWFEVPDSREGWAKALEVWETMAFEKVHADKLLILDFSAVRPKGSPIAGMQNRPSSGPVSLMNAFAKAAAIKGAALDLWLQAMFVDHYFAECVVMGGARRAARMSTKYWRDKSVLSFITVKRPIEYTGLTTTEILEYRANAKVKPQGFLWSSNNSVAVDEEFWELVRKPHDEFAPADELDQHAKKVFAAICSAAYADGTGEPGFINAHKLVQKDEGWTDLNRGDYVESAKYQVNEDTQILLSKLAKRAKKKRYHMITNPCGEIVLGVLGGFCVIADMVPFHAGSIDEAEEAFRHVTRALMRVNLMDSIYSKEVKRTNRIGTGLTGVHEFAWKQFGFGFRDLLDEEKSKVFWLTLARFNRAVADEARKYAKELGVTVPHTMTTVKPAGTTAKLFGLTEGWHLPSMAYYLRWVQFRSDDPLVQQYRNNGYPVRDLQQYQGTTIVGFPTAPAIASLGMGDKLVTAGEATPEEQYRWLMLGEKYWINGTDEMGTPNEGNYGNQISYTLKYKPDAVSPEHFANMILQYQSQVRCCSVMPQEDDSSYEYLPEQPITKEEYDQLLANLEQSVWKKSEIREDIGREHVDCLNGACPIDFKSGVQS